MTNIGNLIGIVALSAAIGCGTNDSGLAGPGTGPPAVTGGAGACVLDACQCTNKQSCTVDCGGSQACASDCH